MVDAISILAAVIVAVRWCAFVVGRKKPYLDGLGLDDAVDVALDQIATIKAGRVLGLVACCKVLADAVEHGAARIAQEQKGAVGVLQRCQVAPQADSKHR
jgi:hypothetical protein